MKKVEREFIKSKTNEARKELNDCLAMIEKAKSKIREIESYCSDRQLDEIENTLSKYQGF
jgi:hypothetical protein